MKKGKRIAVGFVISGILICLGLYNLSYKVNHEFPKVSVQQESDKISHKEAKSRELYIVCEISKTWKEKGRGIGAQCDWTVVNNTKYDVKDWKIKMDMSYDGRIDSIWNVDYTKKGERITYIPRNDVEDMEHIEHGGHRTFGMVVKNEMKRELPNVKNIEIIGYKQLNLLELPAFWVLILCAMIWLIFVVAYLYSCAKLRKANLRHLLDQEMIFQSIYTFTDFIDAKDTYTRGHSVRVATYAREIAKGLGLPQQDVDNIYYAGLLHDAGKIGIPDAILNKPGKLTEEERQIINAHTTNGVKMLRHFTVIDGIQETALTHHERFDGTGYPNGKKGKMIPLYGRIVCVADSYDAMASDRVYRKHLPEDKILEELRRNSGTQFDPEIVAVMIELIQTGRIKELDMEISAITIDE